MSATLDLVPAVPTTAPATRTWPAVLSAAGVGLVAAALTTWWWVSSVVVSVPIGAPGF